MGSGSTCCLFIAHRSYKVYNRNVLVLFAHLWATSDNPISMLQLEILGAYWFNYKELRLFDIILTIQP